MQTMTIESYGNNVLDETMSKRRSNSVVWTHEWHISLSGEVLWGDEFVQIHCGDKLKRF